MGPEEWRAVERAIESFLPYYERVNVANTFGRLPFWRQHVADTAGVDDAVLEIGSGSGGFARHLRARRVYCLDPSSRMLAHARHSLSGGRYRFLSGLAEGIPLRGGSVDKVYCSFSFRDFLDKPAAIREMARVLRRRGEMHVLEAARPPPGWRRAFMDAWLNHGARAIVTALVPRKTRRAWKEQPFAAFVRTYEALGAPEAYAEFMRTAGFEDAGVEYLSMRSVFHLWGVRARTT
jgi:demethylmenaquinone methyltransferase/2-methoxy-6-polyprenyl-1,4-benzoquinol methylase